MYPLDQSGSLLYAITKIGSRDVAYQNKRIVNHKQLTITEFYTTNAKLPETNYQKPIILQIRCKGTAFNSFMQVLDAKNAV
jgi:hypothetical protein